MQQRNADVRSVSTMPSVGTANGGGEQPLDKSKNTESKAKPTTPGKENTEAAEARLNVTKCCDVRPARLAGECLSLINLKYCSFVYVIKLSWLFSCCYQNGTQAMYTCIYSPNARNYNTGTVQGNSNDIKEDHA